MSSVESVKVAVRVRPYNGREKENKCGCIIKVRERLPPDALPRRAQATTSLLTLRR